MGSGDAISGEPCCECGHKPAFAMATVDGADGALCAECTIKFYNNKREGIPRKRICPDGDNLNAAVVATDVVDNSSAE